MPERVPRSWFAAWSARRTGLTRWDLLAALLVLGVLAFVAEATRGLTQRLGDLSLSPVSLSPENLPWYAARTTCLLYTSDAADE